MNELLKELESVCYDSSNMYYLLRVIEKGAEHSENFIGEDNLKKNIIDLYGALDLVSKMQDDISDRAWDLYYKFEALNKTE